MSDLTKQELTESQSLHIEIDSIISDLTDLAVEWDDPTDYPMLEVDAASNKIVDLALDYANSRALKALSDVKSKASQHFAVENVVPLSAIEEIERKYL